MSQLYVSSKDVVVANGYGPTALFRANVPRPLRPSLVEAALGRGVRPADGKAPELPAREGLAPDTATISAAIRRIMDRGNKSDFTAGGLIRVNVLEKEVGRDISTEDRDAAMALIDTPQDN